MAKAELNVEIRENTGKGVARKLRAAGMVPAVVYGKGMEPTPLIVEPKALETAIATDSGWNTLLTLKGAPAIDGKVVVLKELDLHPIKRHMVCADFHVINLLEKSNFMVPVVTVGTSAGEKAGGALQVVRHELEVYCLPTDVPAAIEINVEALEIGDVLHIEEIAAPADAELVHDVNFTVITVVGIKEEVEEVEEGEEGEEAAETEEGAETAEDADSE